MFRLISRTLVVLGLLASAAPAEARPMAAFAVTNCTQAGIEDALSKNNSITFNCGAGTTTIPITREIYLQGHKTIDGGNRIILDGQNNTRIIRTSPYDEVLLMNIILRNGRAKRTADEAVPGQGGALLVGNWADITIQNVQFLNNTADANGSQGCEGGGAIWFSGFNYSEVFDSVFTGNSAQSGGAIFNLTADLVIHNTRFENNISSTRLQRAMNDSDCTGGGGAIFIDGAGPTSQGGQQQISIAGSTFNNNTTDLKGGAIFLFNYISGSGRDVGDHVTIDQTEFINNRAVSATPGDFGTGGGGAIDYQGSLEGGQPESAQNTLLTIQRSTFRQNHADFLGGAIWNEGAPMEMANVTIVNNNASNSKTSIPYNRGAGGGLMLGNGRSSYQGLGAQLVNVTIANNSDNETAGGIGHWGSTSPTQARMANTIIANNTSARGAANCSFTTTNLGGNVQYPALSGAYKNCSGSVSFGNPNFGALGDHGGRTSTLPINSGSHAINRGAAAYCTGLTQLDQRGYARSGACDSGAYEFNGIPLTPTNWIPIVRR